MRSGLAVALTALALASPSVRTAGADAPKLIVGTKEAAPFAMRHSDPSWSGISIELWRRIAEDLGLAYELRAFDLVELLERLEDGSLDVVVAALTVTEQRETRIDFTHPYFSSGLGIAVRAQPGGDLLGVLRGIASGRAGDPDRIRTCDLPLRRRSLYPAELRGLTLIFNNLTRIR